MALDAFSDDWAVAFKGEVNKSTAYRAAAKGGKWTVGLVVEAEPDTHVPEARGIVMDLCDGDARDIQVGPAADAATCADGLVLDVFTVSGAYGIPVASERWLEVAADVQAALEGRVPLRELLGARAMEPEEAEAIHVSIDNAASQFFSVVEVHAPDQVGLLYRITSALHELGLDIHHAKIATHPEGALDVFYVWDLSGEKLDESGAKRTAANLAAHLKGAQLS